MSYYDEAFKRAVEVLGSEDRAEEWLDKMSATLGSPPKELCETRQGCDRVLRHLQSVEMALHTEG